ncbi:MAG: hypothetical protein AAGG53_16225, partial [Cyanobacteria bacterium P01_H01_bin.152]
WGDGEFVIGLEVTDKPAEDALAPLLQVLRRQIITLPSGVRLQPVVEYGIAASLEPGQTLEVLYRGAIAAI